jgi:hypothetical protein
MTQPTSSTSTKIFPRLEDKSLTKNDKSAPLKINPSLERLGVLVGDWNLEASAMSFHPDPSAVVGGRVSFRWLENGAFLIEHSESPQSDFPRSTAIMSPDDSAGTYCMLYFDSRGVSRLYQMSLSDGLWKLWRDFPGFSQRFTGRFSEDGKTITAEWEKSSDGVTWEHDFNLTYTKVK